MKKYLKQFAGLATGLEKASLPLHSARIKLTALYILNTFVILVIFLALLGYVRGEVLRHDLQGQLANPALEQTVIDQVWTDLQESTGILVLIVLLAIGILSYFSVELTLRPIRQFLESHRRFIADASHELRTPLATMRTEIEVALLDPESITKQESLEILESNVEEIDRMSQILNNLLNLASFNDVTGEPPVNPVEMSEIIERSIDRVGKFAKPKRISIDASEVEPLNVLGNAAALEEIVINLLKNAVNYSHPGDKVQISFKKIDEDSAEFVIRDNGVGIAPEDLPHVFEPFYRGERSFHMHKSGSGLGLPLVKELIKRHKGTIQVQSIPEKGTTITVRLPLAPEKSKKNS